MIGKIYAGVSAIIFMGGCAFFKEDVRIMLPVLVMVSVGWPVILASTAFGIMSETIKY
jgi:hypothetical protein